MMNKLIERIDRYAEMWHNYSIAKLLNDCKAQIEILQAENESLRNQNTEMNYICAELEATQRNLQDVTADLNRLEAKPVGYAEQSALDELANGQCSAIQLGSYSERYRRTLPLYTSPPNIEAHGIAPPDGYVLVPVEPTEAMLDAGYNAKWDYPFVNYPENRYERNGRIYKAMLSAVKEKE